MASENKTDVQITASATDFTSPALRSLPFCMEKFIDCEPPPRHKTKRKRSSAASVVVDLTVASRGTLNSKPPSTPQGAATLAVREAPDAAKRDALTDRAVQTPIPARETVIRDLGGVLGVDPAPSGLSRWLPHPGLCEAFRGRGIVEPYEWQQKCLSLQGVLEGDRSLVYCAPTSGGKSLVADLLMLRRVLATGKMALLVLPFVALCAEKESYFRSLTDGTPGLKVSGLYGSKSGMRLPPDTRIAVCVIEKANALVSRLLEEGSLGQELCMVVVDELHMVADSDRGYLLEIMLAKLLYSKGCGQHYPGQSQVLPPSPADTNTSSGSGGGHGDGGLQIVGMSATLADGAKLAHWLKAEYFVTEYRPVRLDEFYMVGATVYRMGDEGQGFVKVRTLPLAPSETDHVRHLCQEVVDRGKSVLVFCATKKGAMGCEATALDIARKLPELPETPLVVREAPPSKKRKRGRASEANSGDVVGGGGGEGEEAPTLRGAAQAAVEELRRKAAATGGEPNPVLVETLAKGVGVHHASLSVEEKELVERCFRRGIVRVLTATSTLAAGVNLPAARVIFREPKIGLSELDGTRYQQMAGRAGRAGIDTEGESYIIAGARYQALAQRLLSRATALVQTSLTGDKALDTGGVTRALLEMVVAKGAISPNDIQRFARCTLVAQSHVEASTTELVRGALHWLAREGRMLTWDKAAEVWKPTALGSAVGGSGLSPEDALIVFQDLKHARAGFVLSCDLHMVYQVTPVYTRFKLTAEQLKRFVAQLKCLSPAEKHVVEILGRGPAASTTATGSKSTSNAMNNKNKVQQAPAVGKGVAAPGSKYPANNNATNNNNNNSYNNKNNGSSKSIGGSDAMAQARVRRQLGGSDDSCVEGSMDQVLQFLDRPGYRLESLSDHVSPRVEQVYRRLHVALMLSWLVMEKPLASVEQEFGVPRGDLQGLQDTACRFASMVAAFCSRLGWADLEGLISLFANRLQHGARLEHVELARIPFVGAARARQLAAAGFRTIQAVAQARPEDLAEHLQVVDKNRGEGGGGGDALVRQKENQAMRLALARRIRKGAVQLVREAAAEAMAALEQCTQGASTEGASTGTPGVHGTPALALGCTPRKIAQESPVPVEGSKADVRDSTDTGALPGVQGAPSAILAVAGGLAVTANPVAATTVAAAACNTSSEFAAKAGSLGHAVKTEPTTAGSRPEEDRLVPNLEREGMPTKPAPEAIAPRPGPMGADTRGIAPSHMAAERATPSALPSDRTAIAPAPPLMGSAAARVSGQQAHTASSGLQPLAPAPGPPSPPLPFSVGMHALQAPVMVDSRKHFEGGPERFLECWASLPSFAFDLHFKPVTDESVIAANANASAWRGDHTRSAASRAAANGNNDNDDDVTLGAPLYQVLGVAVYWDAAVNSSNPEGTGDRATDASVPHGGVPRVHYLCLAPRRPLQTSAQGGEGCAAMPAAAELWRQRWCRVGAILGNPATTKVTWKLKEQLKALRRAIAPGGPPSVSGKQTSGLLPPLAVVGPAVFDVLIEAWMASPDAVCEGIRKNHGELKLDTLAAERLTDRCRIAAARLGNWVDITRMEHVDGCCLRVVLASMLHRRLMPELVACGLDTPLAQVEMPSLAILADMELRGIGFDVDECQRSLKPLTDKLESVEARWRTLTASLKCPSLLITSNKHVSLVFFKHLGFAVPRGARKNKDGTPSTSSKVMERLLNEPSLSDDHRRLVASVALHRTLRKRIGEVQELMGFACRGRAKQVDGGSSNDDDDGAHGGGAARKEEGTSGTYGAQIGGKDRNGGGERINSEEGGGKEDGKSGRHRRALARLRGTWLQTSTPTGRLAVDSPNLQCVTRSKEFACSPGVKLREGQAGGESNGVAGGGRTEGDASESDGGGSGSDDDDGGDEDREVDGEGSQEMGLSLLGEPGGLHIRGGVGGGGEADGGRDGDAASSTITVAMRNAFVARPGWVLLSADYMQAEFRVMAHLSADPALVAIFSDASRGDVFRMLAAKCIKKQPQQALDLGSVTEAERDTAKQLVYGVLYGMGAATLAAKLRCCEADARRLIADFDASFPRLAEWRREQLVACQKNGYITTVLRRRRWLKDIHSKDPSLRAAAHRVAINSICQGSAADMAKSAMVNLHAWVMRTEGMQHRCYLVLQMHDELILEVEAGALADAACALRHHMEHALALRVPTPVKVRAGPSWGTLQPYAVAADA